MKRLLLIAAMILGMGCLGVSAQDGSSGTLDLGQPLPSQIEAGETLSYDYTVVQPSQVTIQALGDTVQPSITVLRENAVVAAQPNADGTLTASLTALLDPGAYVVQIAAANNAAGLVVVVLQSEIPVSATTLSPATLTNGVVNTAAPLALYRFDALPEAAFLYVESGSTSSGVSVRLVNTTTGSVSGQIAPDILGGRLRIAPGSAAYQVEVRQSAAGSADAFTICFAAVSASGCEAGSPLPVVQPTTAQQLNIVPTADTGVCIVTASASGGVNIRQSASTNSIIIGRLPSGLAVNTVGISPDGQFFNIFYDGVNGWVALSVVTSSGNCAGVPIVNPPPIIVPTALPAPTQAPTQPPPPTASGPCLITITSPTYVYTTTSADPSDLFDQVQGGELIPIGRLADNSWWKTNYNSAWIQTSTFGNSANVSGDCSSLPVVTP